MIFKCTINSYNIENNTYTIKSNGAISGLCRLAKNIILEEILSINQWVIVYFENGFSNGIIIAIM